MGTIDTMLRSGYPTSIARSSFRSLTKLPIRSTANLAHRNGSKLRTLNFPEPKTPVTLALATSKPFGTSLLRCAQTIDKIDKKHEDQLEHEKIVPHPAEVSTISSVHQVFHEKGVDDPEQDVDMLAGIKSDWVRYEVIV